MPDKAPNWEEIMEKKRRIVFETLNNKNLYSMILDFNRKYLYWSELKYRVKDKDTREAVWAMMKILRGDSKESYSFKQIKLKYNLIPEISKKLHYFDKQLAGNIASQTSTLGLEEKYIISSLMEEAIASSMIEGAATTRKVAKEMLQRKRKPQNKSERMILNNYLAMEMIGKRKNEKLTSGLLLDIQRTVTNKTLANKKDEGSFRNNNDIIISDGIEVDKIAHTPPDYKNIPSLIKELCDFANNESEDFIHPIIKGIILHFLIGYIHPFNDGNGRTARSVFYWYMLSRDYWLFEYLAVSRRIVRSRKDYDLAYLYTEYDELDLTYFIKYNIKCIDESLGDLFLYIKEKQKEQKEMRNISDEKLGLNTRQIDILRKFRQEPNKLFTIKEIQVSYGTTYATSRSDLLTLEEKRIITKRLAGKEFVFSLVR